MDILLVTFVVSGLALIAISIPLILEKIRPNYWYGFRIRKTLENPRIWYLVNKHMGKRLLVAGIITVFISLVLYLVPGIDIDSYSALCGIIFAGVITIGIIQSWRYMNSLT